MTKKQQSQPVEVCLTHSKNITNWLKEIHVTLMMAELTQVGMSLWDLSQYLSDET